MTQVASKIPPGIAIDSRGAAVMDPTQNVWELVLAESKYQDAMRDSLKDRWDESHSALKEQIHQTNAFIERFQNAQREAETNRIDQLAQTRQEFQNTIRDMLAESVRTTSTLVSTQLVQIQATFDTRVSKLEAYQFTQAGRSSVTDPATDGALSRMAASIAALSATIANTQSGESRQGGNMMGREQSNARLLAIVMAVAAVASPVIATLVVVMAMKGH
jgi:DNA anti-recombination protein RmuC